MFFGEYQYKIDEKGRILIPPRFRRDLKEGMVLAPGAEKCIAIYSPADWKKLAASFTGGPLAASKVRRLKRTLFATAFYLKMDGQGRIALPNPLRQHANITDAAVIIGVNDYLEVWSQQAWEEEKGLSQAQAWNDIESLERH